MGIHPGSDSHDSLVRRTIVRRNGNCGLFICAAVKRCRFEDNRIVENSGPGVSIGSRSTDNAIVGNRIIANAKSGIEFREEQVDAGAHRNRFERNVVLNNGSSDEGERAAVVIRGHHHDLVFRQNTIGHDSSTDERRFGILASADSTGLHSSKNTFQNVESEVLRQGE